MKNYFGSDPFSITIVYGGRATNPTVKAFGGRTYLRHHVHFMLKDPTAMVYDGRMCYPTIIGSFPHKTTVLLHVWPHHSCMHVPTAKDHGGKVVFTPIGRDSVGKSYRKRP